MKQLKRSFVLLMLLTSIVAQTFAQTQAAFNLDEMLTFSRKLELQAIQAAERKQERAKEVMQGNGYTFTGNKEGIFLSTSLMLNGKPLDFSEFNLSTRGELTVRNAVTITDQATLIPFYVYLKRNGTKVLIPGQETVDTTHNKLDISEVLRHAQPGDYLVIEAVNKEDRDVKSVLKLFPIGC